MNGVSLKLSLLAALVLWTTPSWGQFAPQSACQNGAAPRTSIYYVNGVTTTLDEARLNGGKLELEFLTRLPAMPAAIQSTCYLFFLNYNPTSGTVKDFTEAGQQRLGVNPSDMWRKLETFASLGPTMVSLLQGPMTQANQIDQAAVQRHAAAYRAQMTPPLCRRVVVVPHSQGNLYANAAYDAAVGPSPAPAPAAGALKIVGVATPDTLVKGNGRYQTSTGDLLIGAIDVLLPSTLDANTNWGTNILTSFIPLYSGGHSFMGYLSFDDSRSQILSDIQSSLSEVNAVTVCP
ncbi:MAG: hypothetical protein ABL965_04355 [Nitrospira sp.]|nr:MAG: hypothetical protein CAF44_007225 [Nitrospira sp. CG24D]TKB85574.1 MAG: hypothetical protein E8D44_03525 [Nitrospira sp.]